MHHLHSYRPQDRRQAATEEVLNKDLLDGGSSHSPTSADSPVPSPFSPCLPPEEPEFFLHGSAAPGGFAADDTHHHHSLVPSLFPAPLSPTRQDPDEQHLTPTQVPSRYVLHGHPPDNAADRRRLRGEAVRHRQARKDQERRSLQARLDQLMRETEELQAEKLRLQQVTSFLQQDLGSRRQALASLQVSTINTDADASPYT